MDSELLISELKITFPARKLNLYCIHCLKKLLFIDQMLKILTVTCHLFYKIILCVLYTAHSLTEASI